MVSTGDTYNGIQMSQIILTAIHKLEFEYNWYLRFSEIRAEFANLSILHNCPA